MAIGESIKAAARGDLEQAFGFLWLSQDEIDRGRLADSRLDQLNRNAFEAGKISGEEYAARYGKIQASSMDALLEDPMSSPWSGFKEGLKEGAENVQGAVKNTLAAPFNFAFGSIPWQVWLLGLVALAWYLGLFGRLKGALR